MATGITTMVVLAKVQDHGAESFAGYAAPYLRCRAKQSGGYARATKQVRPLRKLPLLPKRATDMPKTVGCSQVWRRRLTG
jgi:hypothetical protein